MQNQIDQSRSPAFEVVKGALLSLAFSLVGAFLFALVLRAFPVPNGAVLPVNQIVKILAIFVGVLFSVRNEKGLLKGVLIGVFTALLTCLAFSALGGDFSLSWLIVVELFVCALVGGLSGVFAVNARRN